VPVQSIKKGLKLLVYGRSKTGKTSLFGTMPTPSLLIGTEDGTASISGVDGIDFARITSSEEFGDLVKMIPGSKYRSVGLDTGGGLQDVIVKEALGLDEVPLQRTYGMGSGVFKDGRQMWGVVGMQFKERVVRLLMLAEKHEVDVMVIAHERNFNEENTHELLTPTVGASLTPGVCNWMNGASNIICQTFVREETKTVRTKVAGKEISQNKKTGKVEFCLRLGQHPIYLTGVQCGKKASEIPDVIVDPSFDKIKRAIGVS
jgi:hypothetical protein